MTNEHVPYLCGGTFFLLLLKARPEAKSRRERLEMRGEIHKNLDNNNEPDVLQNLILLFYPTFYLSPQEIKKDVSYFKSCQKSYTVNIPFDNNIEIKAFHRRVEEHYQEVLCEVQRFVRLRLEHESVLTMKWLIQALLTLIECNTSN